MRAIHRGDGEGFDPIYCPAEHLFRLRLISSNEAGANWSDAILRVAIQLDTSRCPDTLLCLADARGIVGPCQLDAEGQYRYAEFLGGLVPHVTFVILARPEYFTTTGPFLCTGARMNGFVHCCTSVEAAEKILGFRLPDVERGMALTAEGCGVVCESYFAAHVEHALQRRSPREWLGPVFKDEIRRAIVSMRASGDLWRIVEGVYHGLRQVGVGADSMVVALVYAETSQVERILADSEGCHWMEWKRVGDLIFQFWRGRCPVYRPHLSVKNPHGEHIVDRGSGELLEAIVDIPFSYGTISMASRIPHHFSTEDISLLQMIGELAGEAVARYELLREVESLHTDTAALTRRNKVLETIMLGIEELVVVTNDAQSEQDFVGAVCAKLIELFRLRSVTVGRVSDDGKLVVNTHNYVCYDKGKGKVASGGKVSSLRSEVIHLVHADGRVDSRVIVGEIPVVGRCQDTGDPDDKMAITTQSGRMRIWEGYGHAMTETPVGADSTHKVAYFIPVKHCERVLMVLATGSVAEEREQMTKLFETMEPLFNHIGLLCSIRRAREAAASKQRARVFARPQSPLASPQPQDAQPQNTQPLEALVSRMTPPKSLPSPSHTGGVPPSSTS